MLKQAAVAIRTRAAEPQEDEPDVARIHLAHILGPISQHYNQRLFRIARSILRDDAEAEDAVQESYVRALVGLGDLKDATRAGAWLARITVNESLQRLRRRRESIPLTEISETLADDAGVAGLCSSPTTGRNPEDATMHEEARALIEQAIDKLPVHFRVVFVACEIEQMPLAEAAAALGVHPVTVKTRLFRARRLLRQVLSVELLHALPSVYACAGERCERITAGVAARLGTLSAIRSWTDLQSEGDW
ncbi:MAG: RNA polymerase sigma factor [Acetobacteraceae bacterium]